MWRGEWQYRYRMLIMFTVALAGYHGVDQIPLLPQADFVTSTLVSQSSSATFSSKQWPSSSPLPPQRDGFWSKSEYWNEEATDSSDGEYITISTDGVFENDDAQVEADNSLSDSDPRISTLFDLFLKTLPNAWYTPAYPKSENALGTAWTTRMKSWVNRKISIWLREHEMSTQQMGHDNVYKISHSRMDRHSNKCGQDNVRGNRTQNTFSGPAKHNDTKLGTIPGYVLEYAPLVHLFSGEQYWPCDIAEHLKHVTPQLNYTPIQSEFQHLKLSQLDRLNKWPPHWVYLTSNDDPEAHPDWLEGVKNIPVVPDGKDDQFLDNDGWVHHPGRTYFQGLKDSIRDLKDWYGQDDRILHDPELDSTSAEKHIGQLSRYLRDEARRHVEDESPPGRIRGGRSDAPAILIVVDKGDGIVDAFWFFFYSFNQGNSVFSIRFGNHVGDWEHTAVRFHNGTPTAVFFSEHNFGSVYSYEAVEKLGKRPVTYSATGTHAMYATPGLHPYILPLGILHDQTDRGPLWDPLLNAHTYTYNHTSDVFKPSTRTPDAPIGWLNFAGRWGDMIYPLGDDRQYRFAGQYHYVSGPRGPKDKQLGRTQICAGPETIPCVIKNWLPGPSRVQRWNGHDKEFDEPPDA